MLLFGLDAKRIRSQCPARWDGCIAAEMEPNKTYHHGCRTRVCPSRSIVVLSCVALESALHSAGHEEDLWLLEHVLEGGKDGCAVSTRPLSPTMSRAAQNEAGRELEELFLRGRLRMCAWERSLEAATAPHSRSRCCSLKLSYLFG
jgi:hypothetical protein